MNSEERDSQLSAMFDDELPEAECELLARRLARDEALKTRWGRYATIGAAIRAERGVTLESRLALRVASAVSAEPSLAGVAALGSATARRASLLRWSQPVIGVALAAGVAAVAVLWMRDRSPAPVFVAELAPASVRTVPADPGPPPMSLVSRKSASGQDSYTVPAASRRAASVPPAQLANYVVAHSQFAMPWLRGTVLSSLGTAEALPPSVTPPASSAGSHDAAEAR